MLGYAILLSSLFAASLATTQQTFQHYTLSALSVADLALQKVLQDASPIWGDYETVEKNTSTWMKKYPDSTKLVHMNLPGTHDTATWNYSLATQRSLLNITALGDNTPQDPRAYRCQDRSIASMLNAGIRVFDLRFALDVTNTTLVFWHSEALQSQTATVADVLFGFYNWLSLHPSEALLLSFQYEESTTAYGSNSKDTQLYIFDILTSPAARKYFVQTTNELGTLGEARGKITLLRRFDLDQLPDSYGAALPGLHFPPALWIDNSPDITITYNQDQNLTAYIEDVYAPVAPLGSPASLNIQLKYNATSAHLLKAVNSHPDSLFWTWASSENVMNVPADTPRIMALGNGTELTPEGGVNQKLLPFLEGLKGKRVGIVMFDFYETPGSLVETLLRL